jgi:hypothetical protein
MPSKVVSEAHLVTELSRMLDRGCLLTSVAETNTAISSVNLPSLPWVRHCSSNFSKFSSPFTFGTSTG